MSLLRPDSRAPRSMMVSSRRSFLTGWSTRSGRPPPRELRKMNSPMVPPTRMRTAPAITTSLCLLHPCAFGRRELGRGTPFAAWDGAGFGEPFGPARLGVGSGWLVGVKAAVTGSDFIDPHSTGVNRHQLEVAVQL